MKIKNIKIVLFLVLIALAGYIIYTYTQSITIINSSGKNDIQEKRTHIIHYPYQMESNTSSLETVFQIKDKSNSFYVCNLTFKFNEKSKNEIYLSCYTDPSTDFNANRTSYTAQPDENGECKISRVVKSDSKGELLLHIDVDATENIEKLDYQILSAEIIPIEKSLEYRLIQSKDKTIRMVLSSKFPEDYVSYMEETLEIYSQFRKDILWLTGGKEPYYGTTDYLLTDDLEYYALAGDPIYVNQKDLIKTIKKSSTSNSKDTNILWELVHELSHTFDGITGSNLSKSWDFDSEFFADLKMIYVLEKNGYPLTVRDNGSMYGIDEYLLKETPLDNGVYTSEGFVITFINAFDNHDELWNILHDVFLSMENDDIKFEDDDKRFSAFWKKLNQLTKKPVEDNFTAREWDVISKHFAYIA